MFKSLYRDHLSIISNQIIRLFPLIIILFLIFLLNRVIFFCFFSNNIQFEWFDVLRGFLLGIRYDSATIIYALSIPILLFYCGLIIPSKYYIFLSNTLSKIWITVILCFIIFIFVIDIYFFEFYQDHLNIIFFDLFLDDTTAVIYSIWKNYPVFWILLILFAIAICFYKLLDKLFNVSNTRSKNYLSSYIIILGSLILFAIMARASFGLFPINMMDAAYTDNQFLNKLGPNPVFTFEKAIEAHFSKTNSPPSTKTLAD